MQGGIWPDTINTAEYYLKHYLVDRVIISTWEDEQAETDHPGIEIIKNKYPSNPGQGNINLQIVSSLEGIKRCFSLEGIKRCKRPLALKTRTDQRLTHNTIERMRYYWSLSFIKYLEPSLKFHYNQKHPKWFIFVIGNQSRFPFQPQDHLFMGFKQDLFNLFDICLNEQPVTGQWTKPGWGKHQQRDTGLDFKIHLRMPIYLGASYYARFDKRVGEMLDNWQEYLTDNAPKRDQAMKVYEELKNDVFKPFPKFIDMYWEKYSHGYPYAMYEQQGEYYGT